MLSVNHYTQEYIEACRARVTSQVTAYKRLIVTASTDAVADFEPQFFSAMVLSLDAYFVHRSRDKEGKDGNALTEVRLLCNAILNNDHVMTADKTIAYDPATSVLKHNIGDEIRITEPEFTSLAAAFFHEIEEKYSASARALASSRA